MAQRFSIGLTGGIGSGKSTVANLFAARGATLIDADEIAHRISAPGGVAIAAIAARFGASFITPEGALDRAAMRALVFTDPDARHRLEAILHPLIRAQTEYEASHAAGAYIVYVVPLLVESGAWRGRVSRVLVVDCSEQVQVQRVMQRNGLPEAEVRAIMATQATRTQRLAVADDVVLNESDTAALEPQVERLHRQYLKLAARTA